VARKLFFGLLWLGSIGYAFVWAPPDRPDTWELIQRLSTGQWAGINPLVVALFNLMGVMPLIYACFLLVGGRAQKIRAYPFAIASFAVGAFAILPYLALKNPALPFVGQKDRLLKLLDSPGLGFALTLASMGIAIAGVSLGNWMDFVQQWQTSRFINVMSLDFLMLSFLLPTVVTDDLALRQVKNPQLWQALAFIPLFGALIYLCFRPPLAMAESLLNKKDSSTL
jgi:hypothetical protein